jgi:hypothetical protein
LTRTYLTHDDAMFALACVYDKLCDGFAENDRKLTMESLGDFAEILLDMQDPNYNS